MVLSFLNQKGGVGKTTLALNVAGALVRRGRRVLLVDTDMQCSAIRWSSARAGDPELTPLFSVAGLPSDKLHLQLDKLAEGYDDVVIDAPPRLARIAGSVALASDVIIIPVQPSGLDVWATEDTTAVIDGARGVNRKVKVAFVVNRCIVNTAIGRDLRQTLATFDLPTLATTVCQRVAFAESTTAGRVVYEMDADSQASAEVEALTEEILQLHATPATAEA